MSRRSTAAKLRLAHADTLKPMTLLDRLPLGSDAESPDALYEAFESWNSARGLKLYPAQEEAALEIFDGAHVVLATPTGSGKSLVAVAAHAKTLAENRATGDDRVSYYTAPIKALVSEKFFDLVEIFGAHNVGMVTGDSAINPHAPVICCTAEILANIALREGSEAAIGTVVIDEFHFVADPQRGWAWYVPLLELPQAQFLLMSATLGDVSSFEALLRERTQREVAVVTHTERPIPLHFYYVMTPLAETVEELISTRQTPIYVVHFSQLDAVERAQALLSVPMASKEERAEIAERIASFKFEAGFGKQLSKFLRHGVGVHHAGMLPKYRRLVEQLAQSGLLKVICGTDTLGVGINVPIRTVLITALSKYDGERTRILHVREFHQIAGRAGRAGFDTAGTVVVQAPEHTIENDKAMTKARAKFGDDQRKLRQVVKKKPPQGFVSWGEPTFKRLVEGEPEALIPQFAVSHSMLLNLLQRQGNPIDAARSLIDAASATDAARLRNTRTALGILKELLRSAVLERTSPAERATGEPPVRMTVELPLNFALNQPLSPFALAAFELFDSEAAGYELDALSIIEATLENPRQVLSAQLKVAKTEAVTAMKEAGLEYSERMARLDEVSYPKPLVEVLTDSFETYRAHAPWLSDFEVQPKSVVRDMLERSMNFGEYVRFYNLSRSEGILLRYLTDAYRAMRQSIPPTALTEPLADLVEWLGEIVRQTDSSLLDEWDRLANGAGEPNEAASMEPTTMEPVPTSGVSANLRAFRVMVRNEVFRRVQLASRDDYRALGTLDAAAGWDEERWDDALADYWDEHEYLDDGAEARSPELLEITESGREWAVRHTINDPAGNHDWVLRGVIDLDASDAEGTAVFTLTDFSRID